MSDMGCLCIMQVNRIKTVIISTRRQFISSFYFHKPKCNIFLQFVLGRILNTFLVSPLTSFEKKENRIKQEKKNTYAGSNFVQIQTSKCVHTEFFSGLFVMKFACLSIKCGQVLMRDACSKYLILDPDSIGSPSQLNFSRKYSL